MQPGPERVGEGARRSGPPEPRKIGPQREAGSKGENQNVPAPVSFSSLSGCLFDGSSQFGSRLKLWRSVLFVLFLVVHLLAPTSVRCDRTVGSRS